MTGYTESNFVRWRILQQQQQQQSCAAIYGGNQDAIRETDARRDKGERKSIFRETFRRLSWNMSFFLYINIYRSQYRVIYIDECLRHERKFATTYIQENKGGNARSAFPSNYIDQVPLRANGPSLQGREKKRNGCVYIDIYSLLYILPSSFLPQALRRLRNETIYGREGE